MSDPITVRLTPDLAVQLRSLATFDRVTLAAEIREAIRLLVDARHNDPTYRKRVETTFHEARHALEALDGTSQILEELGEPFEEAGSVQERERVAASLEA